MERIWCLCPADSEAYVHILTHTAPVLDDAGISFHVAKPGENLLSFILSAEGEGGETA